MKINNCFEEMSIGDLTYLTIPAFTQTNKVNHGFSTRLGGVSEGAFSSMNLGVSRGDDMEKVKKNYEIICAAIGVDAKKTVLSQQEHHSNIRKVTKEDMGKGVYALRDYEDVDGLITNEKDIPLVTFFADCVPLVFLDPTKEVICSVHSGWRGTVQKIATKAMEMMVEEYGCEIENILAAIGPCIGPCHYEVDGPCAKEFEDVFADDYELIAEELDDDNGATGKFLIDLPMANVVQFLECGILEEHITMSNECTYCNPQKYFSHREMGNDRGNLAMIIALK